MDMDRELQEFVTRNKDNLEISLRILSQENAIKDAIWSRTKAELRNWCDKYHLAYEFKSDTYTDMQPQYAQPLKIGLKSPENWGFRLEFVHKNRSGLTIILQGRPDNADEDNKHLAIIKEKLEYKGRHHKGNVNIQQPFDEYARSWETNLRPWNDMLTNDGEYSAFTKRVIEEYNKIVRTLDEYFNGDS